MLIDNDHRQPARFQLRLAAPLPVAATLPDRVALVAHKGDWLLVDIDPLLAPADAWRELLFRGWPLAEVRAEGGGLAALYITLTERRAA